MMNFHTRARCGVIFGNNSGCGCGCGNSGAGSSEGVMVLILLLLLLLVVVVVVEVRTIRNGVTKIEDAQENQSDVAINDIGQC